MDTDGLVREYLARLEAAAAGLPAGRRADLTAEVREHIDTALAEAGTSDEVTVRNILERLGTPEEIVAGEATSAPARGSVAAPASRSWGVLEIVAVLALTTAWPALFYLAPPLGPILWYGLGVIGLVLVWLSRAWSTRPKSIVTAVVVAAYVLFIAFTTPLTAACTTGNPPVPCPAGGPAPVETSIP